MILDDEEKEAKATIAQQQHDVKVQAKAVAAAPPAGVVGAQCQSGTCCDKTTFKFLYFFFFLSFSLSFSLSLIILLFLHVHNFIHTNALTIDMTNIPKHIFCCF